MSRPTSFDVFRGLVLETRPFCLRRQGAGLPSSAPAAAEGAQQERRRGYEEGLAQGRSEGYEEGMRRGQADAAAGAQAAVEDAVADATRALGAQAERLSSLCEAVEASAVERLRAMEDEMLALCYESVCAVLASQAVLPATVRTHLQQVLAGCGAGAVLHVHPHDAALMQESCPAASAAHWVADPAVTLGGCIVVRPQGALDRRMETALARCKEVLLAARTASGENP